MAKKNTYADYLRDEMSSLIDQLQLPDLQKQALKSRWLDQVIWADKKADQCRRWHYRLRLTTIIGGVTLPALVGINFQVNNDNPYLRGWFPYLPFALSQVIAVSAAIEEFCRFGDRWRDYRRMAEDLKAEGWQYLQLSGPYQYNTIVVGTRSQESYPVAETPKPEAKPQPAAAVLKKRTTHSKSYSLFASRVESIIKNDVQNYISDLMKQQLKEDQEIEKYVESAQGIVQDKTLFSQPTPNGQLSDPAFNPQPSAFNPQLPTPNPQPPTPNLYSTVPNPQPPTPNPQPASPYEALSLAYTSAIAPVAPVSPSAVGIAGTLKTRQDTEFKLVPQPAQSLPDAQKVWVSRGRAFGVLAYAAADNNHFHVTLNQGLGAENRNTWFAYAPHVELLGSNGQPAIPPIAPGIAPQPGGGDLNAAIVAAAASLRGMSTADGPDGGNNACAWTVNRVLQKAGIPPLGDNPNYVPALLDALKGGRGQPVDKDQAKAGDLVIACGEAHIGIGLDDHCNHVLSNSSSRACFLWESDTDFDGYYGGPSTIYRLIR
ncbi:DUF4231 domain-containing protein [Kovacikia minuta CCNUW1]|uniref:DUF4231 domain-containing protein n=1 Tax=Kovacikia minuta TaxID=2931930 RepID=UPI001CC9766A|nr:DUF4231 domain-containing protein [Kovacikia minuta]UBF26587.1 DUF4231 domain-containing protein [Kovacikia minuta CCNUW1]